MRNANVERLIASAIARRLAGSVSKESCEVIEELWQKQQDAQNNLRYMVEKLVTEVTRNLNTY